MGRRTCFDVLPLPEFVWCGKSFGKAARNYHLSISVIAAVWAAVRSLTMFLDGGGGGVVD